MYLAPWQIFLGGCVCGAFITLVILAVILIRIVARSGVRVEHVKEEQDNG